MPYIVISNLRVAEVKVEETDGEFCIIKSGNNSRYRVRSSRIYQTFGQALGHLPHQKSTEMTTHRIKTKTPYDYEPGGSMWQH